MTLSVPAPSHQVAEKAGEQLKDAGYWPQLVDMAEHPHGLASLGQQQALLVVCSTQVGAALRRPLHCLRLLLSVFTAV